MVVSLVGVWALLFLAFVLAKSLVYLPVVKIWGFCLVLLLPLVPLYVVGPFLVVLIVAFCLRPLLVECACVGVAG